MKVVELENLAAESFGEKLSQWEQETGLTIGILDGRYVLSTFDGTVIEVDPSTLRRMVEAGHPLARKFAAQEQQRQANLIADQVRLAQAIANRHINK